jgi:hypothetical protein
MIESLAEHGVRAEDLVPALMTTHTVKNPEYDPKAAKEAEAGEGKQEDSGETDYRSEEEAPPPYEPSAIPTISTPSSSTSDTTGETTPKTSITPLPPLGPRHKPINPFGDDDDDDLPAIPTSTSNRIQSPPTSTSPQRKKSTNPFGSDDEDDGLPSFASSSRRPLSPARPSVARIPSFDMEDDGGDIGRPASPVAVTESRTTTPTADVVSGLDHTEPSPEARDADPERTPTREHHKLPDDTAEVTEDSKEEPPSLPSLPGVSTSLTTADENVVLDIRWTVVSSNSPHDGRS